MAWTGPAGVGAVSGAGGPLGPDDYTFDASGLMVLSASYLRRRGYCCRNGCRNCPYGYGPEGAARERAAGEQNSRSSGSGEGTPGGA